MKKLALALVFVSAPAFAATTLVDYKIGIAFSPNPETREVQILADGNVTLTVTRQRNKSAPVVTNLAKLSDKTVRQIETAIKSIPVDAKLVDPDAGRPVCQDIPGWLVTVKEGDIDVTIRSESGCHTSSVNDGEATQIADLIVSLANISSLSTN